MNRRASSLVSSNTAYNVSRDYARNGLNQYTGTTSNGTPTATFAYDTNGNLTSDGSTSFVDDAENRLVSASGAKAASLAYDPLGRLWQTNGGSAGTTRFVYDDDRLVQEFDGSGTILRVYVHGAGADEPVVWYELTGGPVRRFLHSDHQGSITTVADDYGNVLGVTPTIPGAPPNATDIGRFQYTGQAWIAELGMYYYKARFYSPTLGRFMQTDPVGYEADVNLYAYVTNDPINRIDPTGNAPPEFGNQEYSESMFRFGQENPKVGLAAGAVPIILTGMIAAPEIGALALGNALRISEGAVLTTEVAVPGGSVRRRHWAPLAGKRRWRGPRVNPEVPQPAVWPLPAERSCRVEAVQPDPPKPTRPAFKWH